MPLLRLIEVGELTFCSLQKVGPAVQPALRLSTKTAPRAAMPSQALALIGTSSPAPGLLPANRAGNESVEFLSFKIPRARSRPASATTMAWLRKLMFVFI